MSNSIITLTTDFGASDSYVAQMKGVILSINASVRIVDVTHAVAPQDVARAAAILEEIALAFPAGTVHVAVVDPGVGSARLLLLAEAAGQYFLAPDNGLLRPLLRRFAPTRIYTLTADRFWRKPVSSTFHGRDILAPVAAHLSLGADPVEFGPAVELASLVDLPIERPDADGRTLVGRVTAVDSFGNLLTNIREADLPPVDRQTLSIRLGGHRISGLCHCYADKPVGNLLALMGSNGQLEIAINQGHAARELNLGVGSDVRVEWGTGERMEDRGWRIEEG